jgi:hypothetical protein
VLADQEDPGDHDGSPRSLMVLIKCFL